MNVEQENQACDFDTEKEGIGEQSSQLGEAKNNKIPLFWAFIVLLSTTLIVTGFDWFNRTLPAQMIIFSNIAMLAVAVKGFFMQGQPSALSPMRLKTTLENLTVSALAFFMNINLFGEDIRWDYLLDDLWGWHTIWVICATSQLLFLSGLAHYVQQKAGQMSKVVVNQIKDTTITFMKAVKQSDILDPLES